jgi:hypothetical protein
VAEVYPASEPLLPGDLVAFDAARPGHVRKASGPYDPHLMSVVSTLPGLLLGAPDEAALAAAGISRATLPEATTLLLPNTVPVALAGRVPTRVSAENGPIQPGDLLTSSSVPGVAMKALEAGPVLGRALGAHTAGLGVVEAFIMPGWTAPAAAGDAEAQRIRALEDRLASLEAALEALQTS